MTDLYDYMRMLFATIGVSHCPYCGVKVPTRIQAIIDRLAIKLDINKQILASLDHAMLVGEGFMSCRLGEHGTKWERFTQTCGNSETFYHFSELRHLSTYLF